MTALEPMASELTPEQVERLGSWIARVADEKTRRREWDNDEYVDTLGRDLHNLWHAWEDFRAASAALAGAPDETDCCNRNDPSENHAPGCKGKARAAVAGAAERITHGRHCLCSACAAQDWAEPQLAPCGMHGPSCPPVYAPLGAAGDSVGAVAGAAPQTTRNVITQEDLEERERAGDRQMPGAWTFATPPPDDYEGRVVCFEVVRLGDHAHIGISTGRQHASGKASRPTFHRGTAGRIIVAWEDWLHWRAALDAGPEWMWVAEVENPTPAQLDRYTAGAAPADDEAKRLYDGHVSEEECDCPHPNWCLFEAGFKEAQARAAGPQDERLRGALEKIVARAGDRPPYSQMALDMWMDARAALSSPVQEG